jgi:hypothetical protein
MNNEQIKSELELIRERYLKLVDNHNELQKQNSLLEDRILSIVESYSEEKSKFGQDLLDAKLEIGQLKQTINELEIEKQRYKDDCNLAVRLLHQHPNEFISNALDQSINDFTSSQTSTNQSQYSIIVPTFPPNFTTAIPLFNTSGINQTNATVTNDNLRIAESLYKSNTVHRYPSSYFICSNCHKTVKCSDVSVQTSIDDPRIRVVSLTASDDGLNCNPTSTSLESYNHLHMTVKEYQQGSTRRSSHEAVLSSDSIPQMHRV